jgi:Holliday junction resolvasome RuvABC endonuclease subunit
MTTIMGLDLSVRGAAAVAIRFTWHGDWRGVHTFKCGAALTRAATDDERAARLAKIAKQLVRFAQVQNVTEAWIESYAFSRNGAHTAGEVGGVVRVALADAGIRLHTAQMSSARKLVLGHVPRGRDAIKAAVTAMWEAAGVGAGAADDDIGDAMVAANMGLAQAGAYCFAVEAA